MGRMGCGKQGWIDAGAAAAGHTHPTLRATFPSKAGEGKGPLTRACDRIPIAHAIDAEMSFDGRQSSTLSLAHKVAQEAIMRIALPHFAFEMSPPQIAHWRSELQSWRRRARERGELARMSDGELHDIGVSSAERWSEINKPCWRG
jgi:uncharacterized protein YjiS (DUF1127 family)